MGVYDAAGGPRKTETNLLRARHARVSRRTRGGRGAETGGKCWWRRVGAPLVAFVRPRCRWRRAGGRSLVALCTLDVLLGPLCTRLHAAHGPLCRLPGRVVHPKGPLASVVHPAPHARLSRSRVVHPALGAQLAIVANPGAQRPPGAPPGVHNAKASCQRRGPAHAGRKSQLAPACATEITAMGSAESA